MPAPEGELLLEQLATKTRPLPARKVAVLQRGLGKRATHVERPELLQENALRPAIQGDVVRLHEQHAVVLGEPDHGTAQERVSREVKRSARQALQHVRQLS